MHLQEKEKQKTIKRQKDEIEFIKKVGKIGLNNFKRISNLL